MYWICSKLLDYFRSLNQYVNLFGSKGTFLIQKLFWQITRSRVITWQRFCTILILIQHNGKGCLENKQILQYLGQNNFYEHNNLYFETFQVLYNKLYEKKQVWMTKLPYTHIFFVKINRIFVQIGNMNFLLHNQYLKTNKLFAKLLLGS